MERLGGDSDSQARSELQVPLHVIEGPLMQGEPDRREVDGKSLKCVHLTYIFHTFWYGRLHRIKT